MSKRKNPILVDIESVKPFRTVMGKTLYDVPPPPMVIEDFLPAAGVMGLTAQPGVGKTWLAMEVTRTVTSGVAFLGRFKTLRGGVLFVGADSSIYDYARQWTRLTRTLSDEDPTQFEPARFLIQEGFLFEDRDAVRKLIRTHQSFEWGEAHVGEGNEPVRERGFNVIIFDTLSALTNVPESDNTGREQVFRMIRLIAEITDSAIILLHHNAQRTEFNDGTNFRGGTAQNARLDSHVNLTCGKNDPYLIGVTYKKFRGIKPEDFSYRMNVSDPLVASLVMSDEPVTTAQRMQHDPTAEAVYEYIQQHPGARAVETLDALWPRFEKGVETVSGKTVTYPTRKKLQSAVNNRIAAMVQSDRIVKYYEEGKTVYRVTQATQPDEASAAE